MAPSNVLGVSSSNVFIPLTASTKRTKEVTLSLSGTNYSSTNFASGVAFADSAGVWRIALNINAVTSSATSGTIVISGISFSGSQVVASLPNGGASSAYTTNGNGTITWSSTSNSTNILLSETLLLTSKPTWADTNMEGVLPVDVYIPPVSSGVAGIFPATNAELDNVTATRLGLKDYLADKASGTNDLAYNGGVKATISLTSDSAGGSLTTVYRAVLIPYQTQGNTWRLKFNIGVILNGTVRTTISLGINGIKFKNIANYYQAISAQQANGPAVYISYQYTEPNTSNIYISHSSNNSNIYSFSGDVELDSKPTWAY
jgi:hypothetical protein